jgi:hypothetical protein
MVTERHSSLISAGKTALRGEMTETADEDAGGEIDV